MLKKQKILTSLICISLLSITTGLLSSCDKDKPKDPTIHQQDHALVFPGHIEPIKIVGIATNEDGIIDKVSFTYGQTVKAGQLLMTIDSAALQKSFTEALTNFLKAKDSLNTNEDKLKSAKELWDNGLISRNAYRDIESAYYSSNLSQVQAKNTLLKMIDRYHLPINLKELDIEDTSVVSQLLDSNNHPVLLKLTAPVSGIALRPTNNYDTSDQPALNTRVKKNETLLKIGDLSGAAVDIHVDQLDVDKIKPGYKADITSPALPGLTLHGTIGSIGVQADKIVDGQPQFPVKIVISHLSNPEKHRIRIGMSVNAQIDAQEK